jgi:hypothetical protein
VKRPGLVLLALASLCGCAAARCGRGSIGETAGSRTLAIRANAEAAGADGSDERPFPNIGAALEAARDGDTLELRPGIYREALRVEREVTLRGTRAAIIAPADGAEFAIEARARTTIEGLSVRGAAIGLRAAAPCALRGVGFSGQSRRAVAVEGARAELTGCSLSTEGGARDLVGIELTEGAEAVVRDSTLEGPFRFGVRALGGALHVERSVIEGAVVGVACREGCQGRVRTSFLTAGRGAGLVAGERARLEVRDTVVSRFEQCLVANKGSHLVAEDVTTAFCQLSGIASVSARLEARHHIHLTPARGAGIEILGGEALVEEGLVIDPGSTGMTVRAAKATIRGTLVRGARRDRDRDGDFGDGIFALWPERLRLESPFLERNEGTGLTAHGGNKIEALGLEAHGNGLSGVVAQAKGEVRLIGPHVSGSSMSGLVAVEGSSVRAVGANLRGNAAGPAFARCDEGASIDVDNAGFCGER